MAIAIDASTPSAATGTGATVTTASFSTPANSFLLAMVARDVSGVGVINEGTVSGAGLTWTLAGRKGKPGTNITNPGGFNDDSITEMWWASSATALSSVTVSDASTAGSMHILKVAVITGAELTWGGAIWANADNGAGSAFNATVTTTADNSLVISSASDWNATGAGTLGSSQSWIEDVSPGGISAHFWRQTSATPTSGTAVTNNLTAPTSTSWNELIIEIRPGVNTTPPDAGPSAWAPMWRGYQLWR